MTGSSQRSSYRYMIISYHVFFTRLVFFFKISNENAITKLRKIYIEFRFLEKILFTSLGSMQYKTMTFQWLQTEPVPGNIDENKCAF